MLTAKELHIAKTKTLKLEVEDDVRFTCKLYEQKNIKVLPGRFLGRGGVGENYVRIALVENSVKTEAILKEIKSFMSASK